MNIQFDFIGEINNDNLLALRNFIEIQESPISSLTINISSLGGSVCTGITNINRQTRNGTFLNFNKISQC